MIRANYSDYEMFIMMDCDNVCSGEINLDVLKKNLYRNDWDALSFNKSKYYDIWALSINPIVFSYLHFEPDAQSNMSNYIHNIMKSTPKNILVNRFSAFNGFSIYRTNKFLNCYYAGRVRLELIPVSYLKKNIQVNKSQIIFKPIFGIANEISSKFEDCEYRAFHMQAIN